MLLARWSHLMPTRTRWLTWGHFLTISALRVSLLLECITYNTHWIEMFSVDDKIISGKCAIGVLVTHDVFSERIANASSPEEARWELVHSCTLFLCCLDDPYRNPNMNNDDHWVGQLTRWEQIKMVISDVTLTGGCLAAGFGFLILKYLIWSWS